MPLEIRFAGEGTRASRGLGLLISEMQDAGIEAGSHFGSTSQVCSSLFSTSLCSGLVWSGLVWSLGAGGWTGPGTRAISSLVTPSSLRIFSVIPCFHLNIIRPSSFTYLNTYVMSSSSSICRLRLTVQGRPRLEHRVHGGWPSAFIWHLICTS